MDEEEALGMFWWYNILEEENLIECSKCGKEIPKDSVICCDMCGAPLCEECGNLRLCSACAELWEAEIDLEEMEAAEEEL
jgi:predicted amidophosphoribosyltransferase